MKILQPSRSRATNYPQAQECPPSETNYVQTRWFYGTSPPQPPTGPEPRDFSKVRHTVERRKSFCPERRKKCWNADHQILIVLRRPGCLFPVRRIALFRVTQVRSRKKKHCDLLATVFRPVPWARVCLFMLRGRKSGVKYRINVLLDI